MMDMTACYGAHILEERRKKKVKEERKRRRREDIRYTLIAIGIGVIIGLLTG